jgi:hypothetical protein
MFRNPFQKNTISKASEPFYRPYEIEAANNLYNLLFCDNVALLRKDSGEPKQDFEAVLSETTDRERLERIGNDLDVESRVRVLAFNRLRRMNVSVPRKRLLGVIVEVPQRGGLDVLAAFPDGRLRYINHSEKIAIFESTPAALIEKAEELLRASQFVVNRYGPWNKTRLPPPTGALMRMSFLVSDGLYFGQGSYTDLIKDRFALPVAKAFSELLLLLVDTALNLPIDKSVSAASNGGQSPK